jgi:hypothetical protein
LSINDKLYKNNPAEADRLLAQLPDLLTEGQVYPDIQAPRRSLIARPFETLDRSAKNQAAVLEIARAGDSAEIVSIHVMPDRTLQKYKDASGGEGGTAGSSFGSSP